jgi:hypothetical protein
MTSRSDRPLIFVVLLRLASSAVPYGVLEWWVWLLGACGDGVW